MVLCKQSNLQMGGKCVDLVSFRDESIEEDSVFFLSFGPLSYYLNPARNIETATPHYKNLQTTLATAHIWTRYGDSGIPHILDLEDAPYVY